MPGVKHDSRDVPLIEAKTIARRVDGARRPGKLSWRQTPIESIRETLS
jgi:hypothetical protein